jgi:hypothetical protein
MDEDYENVLIPAVRERLDAHEKIRCVYVLGEEFEGWTLGAMWEDAKLGGGDLRAWEKVAVVTDKDWVGHAVKAFGRMIPGDVRVFRPASRAPAGRLLRALLGVSGAPRAYFNRLRARRRLRSSANRSGPSWSAHLVSISDTASRMTSITAVPRGVRATRFERRSSESGRRSR